MINLFRRKPKAIKEAQYIRSDEGLLILLEPQFADMAEDVRHELIDLLGHEAVKILIIPKGSISFISVNFPKVITIHQQEVVGSDGR